MITYKIISRKLSPEEKSRVKRRRLSPDDPDFQERLFERVYQHNPFREGDRVRLVGTKHTATLVNVYSELKDVIWKDDKPHFLVLEFDEDKSRKVATPFQITRKNVK